MKVICPQCGVRADVVIGDGDRRKLIVTWDAVAACSFLSAKLTPQPSKEDCPHMMQAAADVVRKSQEPRRD